jgi:hypothetical protein
MCNQPKIKDRLYFLYKKLYRFFTPVENKILPTKKKWNFGFGVSKKI